MPLKEKEKSLMQKLVSDQKYVDEDFPLPEDNWLRPHVIPVDQPLYGKDYQGILVFRFWYLGKWTPVYIDDRLAVSKNKHLVYGKCTKKNEFWLPLLEKAFANDPKWTGVDEETKKKLEYVKEEDGQFFMRISNFVTHFPMIWFASPFPDFGDNYETTSLQTYLIWNSWDAEITMEGDTPREVFLKSPQYSLTVGESAQPEKNSEDESDIAPTYDVIIEVVQEQNRKEFEEELYPIGIAVFKVRRIPNLREMDIFPNL
ncbi:AGAP012069-PA-like protein [Gryllus bimaculatus]|nr:AGAP012069-PA-like protein [Gryllus bimaculatus]